MDHHIGKHLDSFRKKLKTSIETSGESVEWWANQVGLTRATIYAYMRGTIEPSLSTAIALSKALGFSIDEALGLKSEHGIRECWRRVKSAMDKYV